MEIVDQNNGRGKDAIRNWFEEGEAAMGECKHVEAARCFDRVLKADPFNAKAHRMLSDAYWAQGKTEDALNSLTRALELKPGDRDTVLACSNIFVSLGRKEFAEEVLQSFLAKHPQDKEVRSRLESVSTPGKKSDFFDAAEFLMRRGEAQFERGNIPHAVACFEMAIEENPRMADAYNNLGVIYLGRGNIPDALEYLHKALELKPDGAEILRNSARALIMAGQADAAVDVLREYLRRFPEDSSAWPEFEFLIRQNAVPVWNPNGLSNEVAAVYADTAEKLSKTGDMTGAVEAINRALIIHPDALGALYVLAWLHNALGQKDEARGVLDRALKIDPSHGPCSDMLKQLIEN